MSRNPVKSIDPREAQADRREDVKGARLAHVKKMLAEKRAALSLAKRHAIGNARAGELAKLDLPTSAALIGRMSEKQKARIVKMRAAQEAAGELEDSDPPPRNTRRNAPLGYQR